MDFSLSPEQESLRARMTEFAQSHLNEATKPVTPDNVFDRVLWNKCGREGILGMMTEREHSGSEKVDHLTALIAMEALGYGCTDNGLPFAINANIWTIQLPLQELGTEDQKERFLPRLCSGEWIGCHAMTEPDSGSDAFSMQTRATPCDGGYRLSGEKCMISLAPTSDLIILFATVKPEAGRWGVTTFLVPTASEGITVSAPTAKMGLESVPMGTITFNDCFVPEANRLGPEGAGASIAQHGLEFERCGIFSSMLGRMARQLEDCIAYAKSRKQAGRPIGANQSVSNRIADMKVRLETTRLLAYKLAWMLSQGKPATTEAAMLKLVLSEEFLSSGIDAMRIHGGHGYLVDNGLERDVRDALGGVLYAGTSDIQRNIIAGMLGVHG
ncbi:MAG: acyl-CoA dehydrogenase family protein [Burkholderiaceae bacterium]